MRRRYISKKYNNSIELESARMGDYVYEDLSSVSHSDNIQNVNHIIGLIYYKSSSLVKVMALNDVPNNSTVKWSNNNVLVQSLNNITDESMLSEYFNGENDTYKIVSELGNQAPAAYHCYNYITEGTEVGDWYLPSSGDMMIIYNNRILLNSNLTNIGGRGLHLSDSYQRYYHTSTQYNNMFAWEIMINAGEMRIVYGYDKNSSSPNMYSDYFYARPCLDIYL